MPGMNVEFHKRVAELIGDTSPVVTHLGLVDENGDEISGGTYSRLAVTWVGTGSSGEFLDGQMKPDVDLVFNIPSGNIVAGWRGFTAASSGTNLGGKDFPVGDRVEYTVDDTFTLLADATRIKIESP